MAQQDWMHRDDGQNRGTSDAAREAFVRVETVETIKRSDTVNVVTSKRADTLVYPSLYVHMLLVVLLLHDPYDGLYRHFICREVSISDRDGFREFFKCQCHIGW